MDFGVRLLVCSLGGLWLVSFVGFVVLIRLVSVFIVLIVFFDGWVSVIVWYLLGIKLYVLLGYVKNVIGVFVLIKIIRLFLFKVLSVILVKYGNGCVIVLFVLCVNFWLNVL